MLTAQSAALANARTAVEIQGRRLAASVLLAKALGGGWDPAEATRLAVRQTAPALRERAR